jgi:clan AA aspartic protease
MITGRILHNSPRIRVQIRGAGADRPIVALVDTGFTGWLMLPLPLVRELQLPWRSLGQAALADGSLYDYDEYSASVLWDGRVRAVHAIGGGSVPLIGMSLLAGYELRMQVHSRGAVRIRRLKPRAR